MAYYCVDCGRALPEGWVEKYLDVVDAASGQEWVQCKSCHRADEQLNRGRCDD